MPNLLFLKKSAFLSRKVVVNNIYRIIIFPIQDNRITYICYLWNVLYYTSHSIAYSFSNTPLYFPSYFATFSPLSSFFEYKFFIYISLNKKIILLLNSKSCCIFALFFQAKDMRKQPHRVINNFCLYFKQLIILYLRMSEKIRIFA